MPPSLSALVGGLANTMAKRSLRHAAGPAWWLRRGGDYSHRHFSTTPPGSELDPHDHTREEDPGPYCVELVKAHDFDSYLCGLLMPKEARYVSISDPHFLLIPFACALTSSACVWCVMMITTRGLSI